MSTLFNKILISLLATLSIISCREKAEITGNWSISKYQFYDSTNIEGSSFNLDDEASIRNFLLNSISNKPNQQQQDSMIVLLKKNALVLNADSTFNLKGLGLILPTDSPGYKFDSLVSGKWQYADKRLSLISPPEHTHHFSVIELTAKKLVIELLDGHDRPFSQVVLIRR